MNSSLSPFHVKEQELQVIVGRRDHIEEFGKVFLRSTLIEQHRDFYEDLTMLYAGSVDSSGWPWATALVGHRGFLKVPDDTHLAMSPFRSFAGDQVQFAAGASVGFLGLMHHNRRRNRLNGVVEAVEAGSAAASGAMLIKVQMSYGNCPKYIAVRNIEVDADALAAMGEPRRVVEGRALIAELQHMVHSADCLFISSSAGTGGPQKGVRPEALGCDVSHRGGLPGFVGVSKDGRTVSWIEYAGNNMFNTLGNLLAEPRAGLLFINYETGDVLQLTGVAEVATNDPMSRIGGGLGFALTLRIERFVFTEKALPIKVAGAAQASPYSPQIVYPTGFVPGSAADGTSAAAAALQPSSAAASASETHVRLVSRHEETPSVTTYEFELPPRAGGGKEEPNSTKEFLKYVPGQYATFAIDMGASGDEGKQSGDSKTTTGLVTRTWTVSSHPSHLAETFTISAKRVGVATNWMHQHLQAGSELALRGFAGEFTSARAAEFDSGDGSNKGPEVSSPAAAVAGGDVETAASQLKLDGSGAAAAAAPVDAQSVCRKARLAHRGVLLLAAGIGITPMRSMFHQFITEGRDALLLYTVRDPQDAAFAAELHAAAVKAAAAAKAGCGAAARGSARVVLTVTGATAESAADALGLPHDVVVSGRLSLALLRQVAPDAVERVVYLCGPPGYLAATEGLLKEAGVPNRSVLQESFEF